MFLVDAITVIKTRRNHEHNVTIIIINANNFFGHLLNMLNRIYDKSFADSKNSKF